MPLALSIGLVSAAAIGYEILLMRLFSIILWHHFAYMIISVALLGYGASGTYLTLWYEKITPRFVPAYLVNAALFGLFAVGGFAMAQSVPFNPLEIMWDRGQQIYLLMIYLSLFVPFFFAANCVGLALVRYSDRIPGIYLCNLVGAGAGALMIVGALFAFPAQRLLLITGALGFLAAAVACMDERFKSARRYAPIFAAVAVASLFAWPPAWIAPRISEYKGLSQALRAPDARIVEQRSSPLGLVTVVESPVIPFRHAPGLSLNNVTEPPEQLAVFTDADAMSVITRTSSASAVRGAAPYAYLDYLTWALPYHLIEEPGVLILGAGGGADVLMALYHGASSIDAVELNPQVADLVKRRFADYAGRVYDAPNVRVHIAEARSFVAGVDAGRFDLIQIALLDSFSASASGVGALSESYLYTVEALREVIEKLNPNGVLAVTRWIKLPPRGGVKLFGTAVEALKSMGVANPGRRLALVRSWNTATLLVKKGAFTSRDVDLIRSFCRERSFDIAYAPGIRAGEVNRFNILDEPYFHKAAAAMLGPDRDAFLAGYKFYVAPATDDRPYFFHFFKWSALPELIEMGRRGGFALLEHGYLVLIATLVQAAVVCAALLSPLAPRLRRRKAGGPGAVRVAAYFMALGFGFMFIEIAFIQKFILFLSHPLYATAVALCAFLFFGGLGSGFSARMIRFRRVRTRPRGIAVAVSGIAGVSFLYLGALTPLFHAFMGHTDAFRIVLSIVLIAPLGFMMGMPFPLGLSLVAGESPDLVPWAWAVNGAASVLGAIMAMILSIHFGFTSTVMAALVLYIVASLSFRREGAYIE